MSEEITITIEEASRVLDVSRHTVETIMKNQPDLLPRVGVDQYYTLRLSVKHVENLRDHYEIKRGAHAVKKFKTLPAENI